MALKSMVEGAVCSASTSTRDRASAAVLAVPWMYRMSEVNWAMKSRCHTSVGGNGCETGRIGRKSGACDQ